MSNTLIQPIRKNIFFAILGLAFLSLLLNFVSSSWSRVFFFLTSYLSIISIALQWKIKPKKDLLLITSAIILIGLSKYLWFCFEYIGNPDYNKYNSYFNTGQRLLLGGIISYALFSMTDKVSSAQRKSIDIVFFLTFTIATIIGLHQMIKGRGRIDFYLGFATDSAYMYSTISICTIIILQTYKSSIFKLVSLAALLLSLFIIFKTGTRNILIFYPLILLVSLFAWKKNSCKTILMCFFLFVAAFTIGYNQYIKPKITATVNEIKNYEDNHGNVQGSFTARLAMWNVGYEAFVNNPMSMSLEQREAFFRKYVKETQQNKASLQYVNIHLHNELIETASLQGIPGLIALIVTYVLMLMACLKTRNNAILGVTLTIMSVGLSDVVFISREQTIFFVIIIVLAALRLPEPQKK